MRQSTNVMFATLAIVCLMTLVAVVVALERYDGEGQQEHGEKHGEAQTAPRQTLQHNSAIGRQPTTA